MLKKFIIVIILIVFSLGLVLDSSIAAPKNLGDAFKIDDGSPLKDAAAGAGYNTEEGKEQIDIVIGKVIRTLLTFLGVIFLVLMIYGGYLWMTDRGNEDQVKRAKNLITAAVVGLIIVVSAYAISIYVVGRLTESALDSSVPGSSELDPYMPP